MHAWKLSKVHCFRKGFSVKKFEINHLKSYIMDRKTAIPCLEFILIDLTQYVSTNKSYISIYEIHNNMITIFKL